ncbi:2-hydroxyacid dehydrogenase [Streptomonospora litoralis]|uniref:D-lactate dehydrogenase n=1 Tax=Streptomonospora litoralis TaxID=2498135 RepID=A0A4P6Q1M5_9ACTN|nr:NAD(P)-dependent oxidoreductase [Streptomonospora litoralis]QBI52614.1 D-lactate dehydrogenase [Streptomonospora litoralis]
MTRPNLVMLSRGGRDTIDSGHWTELERRADITVRRLECAPGPAEAAELLAEADLLAATNLCLPTIDADLLDALPRLHGIVLYATGYDHIDIPLLRSRGVGLSVLPEYATTAVAEHCLAMLFALATRLHLAQDRSRDAVPRRISLRGIELGGKRLGVVGLGRIGGEVARLARGLGMSILGADTDPHARARAAAAGVEVADLPAVLAGSDAVAVCASHTFGAAPLLGEPELARMRSGAMLVNVSRSALVDTAAAAAAVRSGRLRGYAVDDTVLDPAQDGDLLAEGRILQTGHSAWWRDETLDRGARMWADRMLAAVLGEPLDSVTWPKRDAAAGLAPAVSA